MRHSKAVLLSLLSIFIVGCNNTPAHNYSSNWSYDENNHWHACVDVGYEELKTDEAAHNFEEAVVEAGFDQEGYIKHTCSICGYSYKDHLEAPTGVTVTTKMMAMVNSNKTSTGYDITAIYKDEFFDTPATTFSNDIKLISFASSCATSSAESADKFYGSLYFDNIVNGGYEEITADTVGYVFSHKTIGDVELVSISIRGFDYGKEWANNFKIGAEGNHQGFNDRANEIYDALKTYLGTYSGKTVKIWATGYSRGGGIANVLASKLLKERNEIAISKENLYVYTFEAPSGLTEENAVKYENVFNLINSKDFIPKIPPVQYELYRCGNDIFVDENKNVDECLLAFDSNAVLPTFTPFDEYKNEVELGEHLLESLLKEPSADSGIPSLHTREDYYNNAQDRIAYMMELFFGLDERVTNLIISIISSMPPMDMLSLLANGGLYNFLKPIFDDINVSYDDDKLKDACDSANLIITGNLSLVFEFVDITTQSINQVRLNNVIRTVYMHSPEVVYSLII